MSKQIHTKKRVSIIGYGRFGKVLHKLLKDDFQITIYQRSEIIDKSEFDQQTKIAKNLEEVYKNDVIFFAIPIESFSEIIASHRSHFRPNHLLIDVLSVKLHPKKVLSRYLRGTLTQALLTHPMFGPDSSKNGFGDLPIIVDKFKCNLENYAFWINFFKQKGLRVVEMSADQHDCLAANSQGLAHFLGRLLDGFGLKPTPIDSLGVSLLLKLKEQTCNDSWQLFANLQHFNPYTIEMRRQLGFDFDKLFNQLLPEKSETDQLKVGIQGGQGSFNEEAALKYLRKNKVNKYKLVYLHTTSQVLNNLSQGIIDLGLFAVHNSIGGMVSESSKAMADHKFEIVGQFSIDICHSLLIRADAKLSDITTIMTHPQVLAQCRVNLHKKYPHIKLVSGKGKLIDHALVAKKLAAKKIGREVATIGSMQLAKIHNLKVVEKNLQDRKINQTTFWLASRTKYHLPK